MVEIVVHKVAMVELLDNWTKQMDKVAMVEVLDMVDKVEVLDMVGG